MAGKWKETYLLEGNDCEDAGLLFLESKAKRCKKIMLGTLQIKFYSVIIRK